MHINDLSTYSWLKITQADVFKGFRDEDGKFKQEITSDVRGLLSLYEASYLGIPDENVLDEAKIFARSHLHKLLYKAESTTITSHQLSRALELPSHWRIRRSEARWHIEQYKDTEGMDPAVLELAMLDFNMVQLVYQTDLEDLNRWDAEELDELPEYMKICFMAVYNTANELAYYTIKQQGFNCLPYLKQAVRIRTINTLLIN
ncbi:unnamed protein product [Linum tenue]|uniref:Uncharacterized protein n=1 Tax=Linum tenue TaxID=586396 RepID=A0AAV0KID6_9ROSI|nr:unnamed protein product [Linum tenue]